MKRVACLILCAFFLARVSADDAVLTLPGEAKGAAMGEAYSASSSGAEGLWYNPATLSRRDVRSASLMHTMYLENTTFDAVSGALPFGSQNAVGVGVSYLSAGSIPSFDNTGTVQPAYTPRDIAARVGVAKTIYGTSAGISAFFLQSTIVESAVTAGLNIGLHQVLGPASLAFVAENYGGKLKYRETEAPLPSRLRAGMSLRLLPSWIFNTDIFKPAEGSVWIGTGTEWRLDIGGNFDIALRGGYNTRSGGHVSGLQGVSAGAGVGIAGSNLNYAWIPYGDVGQTHRLSLDIQFGDQPFNPTSDRELRSQTMLGNQAKLAQKTGPLAMKNVEARKAMALPLLPWKNAKNGWRKAKDKMIDLLARDALCTGAGARALVTRTQGNVTMQPNGEMRKWSRVRSGKYLFEGDTLRTAQSAAAHMVFANGAKAEIGANTRVKVRTETDICEYASAELQNGDMVAVSENGKQLQVTTPLGDAIVKDAEARISYDGNHVLMHVQYGSGTFTSNGLVTTVQARTTFAKSAEGKTEKTREDSPERPIQITEATDRDIPGRWDPHFAKTFQREMMRLDSTPGLQLAEYVRDTKIRGEVKLRIFDMLNRQKEMQTQVDGYRRDVAEFKELRQNLRKALESASPASAKNTKLDLKNAKVALSNAQRSLDSVEKEMAVFMKALRNNQEFLATLPIVRMLNITAQESTIPFDQGRSMVPDSAKPVLDTIAESMAQMRPYRVVVEGHTDKSGSVSANNRLSKQRAQAVAQYLKSKTRLPAETFITKGMGAAQPIEQGDTPEAMAKNRRVEIWFELRGL